MEAVHAGAGVILFPTTSLHEKLSEKYCFANCAVEDFTKDGLSEFIESGKIYPNLFSENSFKSEHEKENESVQISLSDYVKHISLGKKYNCPVCQKSQKRKNDLVVERNMFRTYRRCSECGLVYISWSAESERKYEKEYFFESYKKQYGKTYKEDFNFIKASCMNRVSVIKQLLSTDVMNSKKKNPTVLDIGCAYGPFLQAAGEYGFQPYGTDICEDAVKSVQDELHFPACTSAFPEIDTVKEFGMKYFDAVTMWYVIEHFKNLDAVLLKARKLLKTGGVFAFSTPRGEGVSAKSDRHNFYNISPTDHFSVWEPSRASKILKKYGFKVVKIISTGHHPERFPSIKKSGAEKGSLQWTLVDKYSRLQKLGDTVEIYCVKTERDQE